MKEMRVSFKKNIRIPHLLLHLIIQSRIKVVEKVNYWQ